jgi:hypothetical protein
VLSRDRKFDVSAWNDWIFSPGLSKGESFREEPALGRTGRFQWNGERFRDAKWPVLSPCQAERPYSGARTAGEGEVLREQYGELTAGRGQHRKGGRCSGREISSLETFDRGVDEKLVSTAVTQILIGEAPAMAL